MTGPKPHRSVSGDTADPTSQVKITHYYVACAAATRKFPVPVYDCTMQSEEKSEEKEGT
jgi:hypothetical protein